jgi:hypothetical protein
MVPDEIVDVLPEKLKLFPVKHCAATGVMFAFTTTPWLMVAVEVQYNR